MQKILVYLTCLLSWTTSPAWAQLGRIQKPRLILTLVVDQFRADQLARFQKRFLPPVGSKGIPGGFRYLMERGAYYPLAEYGLLQNMTCPGHATVLSGAYAYQHGIPANTWYNPETQKSVYCVEDAGSPLVGVAHPAPGRGISPKNFRGSTLGDELKNSGYASRVVTVALKDRAAVLMGGPRADLALWHDSASQSWITSRYYRPDGTLPDWVRSWNAGFQKNRPGLLTWSLPSGAASGTSWKSNRLALNSKTTEAIGRDFPHQILSTSPEAMSFPEGTENTVSVAIKALENMKLGQGPDPDLLAVSFSNHDAVSHVFGPNSRELEEMTLVEDREISRLLSAVQTSVGLDHTIIVLTGDHGGMPSPEWLHEEKVDAGRVDEETLRKQGEAFLARTYGALSEGSWLPFVRDFNFYLNTVAVQKQKLSRDEVLTRLQRFYREEAQGMEAVQFVFTAADVQQQKSLPPGLVQQQILHTYSPGRSGDLMMILKPYYVPQGATGEHMSGYAYDRIVPLVLAGPQIQPGIYAQKAEVIDIAPTLAFFVGTTPPSGSEGRVLQEILRKETR